MRQWLNWLKSETRSKICLVNKGFALDPLAWHTERRGTFQSPSRSADATANVPKAHWSKQDSNSGEYLVEKSLQAKPNNNKKRPFKWNGRRTKKLCGRHFATKVERQRKRRVDFRWRNFDLAGSMPHLEEPSNSARFRFVRVDRKRSRIQSAGIRHVILAAADRTF